MGKLTPSEKALPRRFDESTPHILVVDDDRRLRALLKKYLTGNGYRVTTAENSHDAREKLRGLAFDAIVLDVMMPGETGMELTRSLRQTLDVPILLLTAMGEAEDRISGLEGGADDYLPKPFEPRELILRIGAIIRRNSARNDLVLSDAPPMFGDFSFDAERGELHRGRERVSLSTQEAALLMIFVENPGVTFSRAELGHRTGAERERSIDVHIARLRRKLEQEPKAPRYLKTVRGKGYVLWPQ